MSTYWYIMLCCPTKYPFPHITLLYCHYSGEYILVYNALLSNEMSLSTYHLAILPLPRWIVSEWVIKFNGLLGTSDIGVHVVYTSCVIITYILESLSSLTMITHKIQVAINLKKNILKKKHKKWRHPLSHNSLLPYKKFSKNHRQC